MTIALAGKGGVGKTTVAAMLVRYLIERRLGTVLAIDADPSSNLHMALGLPPAKSVGAIREELLNSVDRNEVGVAVSRYDYLNLQIRMAMEEGDTVDLIAMGRPEGPGCYCPVNHMLRDIVDRVSTTYDFIMMDNEAGMEHLSRRTTRDVDVLIVVTDPTVRGIAAAEAMDRLTYELSIGVKRKGLVVNRAPETMPEPLQTAIDKCGLELWATLPEDPLVNEYDAYGKPLATLPSDAPVVQAIERLAETVLQPQKAV